MPWACKHRLRGVACRCDGADWACVSCWDETCDSAKRELLRQRQQPRAKRRKRTQRAASQRGGGALKRPWGAGGLRGGAGWHVPPRCTNEWPCKTAALFGSGAGGGPGRGCQVARWEKSKKKLRRQSKNGASEVPRPAPQCRQAAEVDPAAPPARRRRPARGEKESHEMPSAEREQAALQIHARAVGLSAWPI